ncbi:hypothetical protein BDY24DRAFT_383779 [Mrakia frigida]|uniref:DUF3602 domain-containing protein n=1 Tax=Mrakia frigida TaxID=29902 RepID=UPI003FCC0290
MEAFKERERSQSRGRVSTGRGGAGNIRTASQDPSLSVDDGVTIPVERGRHVHSPSPSRVTHAGRGGAGNVRSPSRDPADHQRTLEEDVLEAQLIRERRAREAGAPHSTGLGGYGNISSRSRSREPSKSKDRSPAPHGHSTGRGGAGNVAYSTDDSSTLRELDEHDETVRGSYDARGREGLTSTGKVGAGNMRPVPDISIINLEDRGTAPHVIENNGEHGRTSGSFFVPFLLLPSSRG